MSALYFNLLNLIIEKGNELSNKRIFMFSYGSGCASAIYTLRVVGDLSKIVENNSDVIEKLNSRIKVSPEDFMKMMERKEKLYVRNNYIPETDTSILRDGTYYLDNIDNKWRRTYKKKENGKIIDIVFNKLSNEKSGFNGNSYSKALNRLKAIRDQLKN